MFEPSKYKHRKSFKGRISGSSYKACSLVSGSFGIKSCESFRITSKHLESIRSVLMKTIKKKRGRLLMRIFPNIPVSKKPADVRMGKGKGSLEFWIFRVKPGRIIFEIEGLTESDATDIMSAACYKIPFKCKMVKNEIGGIR